MERLTIKWKDKVYDTFDPVDIMDNEYTKINYEKILTKLGEYEDLEEQGLLLKLPCRVGDIVYRICPKCNDRHDGSCKNCAWCGCSSNAGCTTYGLWSDGQYPPLQCTIVPYKVNWNYIPNLMEHLGKTVFLTQAEAEEALKRKGREEENG